MQPKLPKLLKGTLMIHTRKKRSFHFRVLLMLLCAAKALIGELGDSECEIVIETCPENFHDSTIFVPSDTRFLSSKIHACHRLEIMEGVDANAVSPTIIFVIDHTGSMMGISTYDDPHDQWGSRFTVTRELLDTMYARWDSVEVGLIIFREHLYLDPTTPDYFSQYFERFPAVVDDEPDQAYLPPLLLHEDYNGKKGIDIIKDILKTDTISGVTASGEEIDYVDLKYKPNFSVGPLTNINGAFMATRLSLQQAIHPEEHQFIIFLSDGEPRGDEQAGKPPNDFINGDSMATTFTVFFPSNREGPESVRQMTENIRENGYSLTNRYSDIWMLETSHEALRDLLMEQVLQTITTVTAGIPRQLVVNDSAQSTTFIDSSFVFSNRFPLSEDTTRFSLKLTYQKTNLQTGQLHDSTITVEFTVVRNPAPRTLQGISIICWYNRGIELLYDGKPVQAVLDHMKELEVRVSTGEDTVSELSVRVTHARGDPSTDRETVECEQQEKWWSGTFQRMTTTDVDWYDDTLQHTYDDSIIVFYEDPDNDSNDMRLAVPFFMGEVVLVNHAAYYDNNADGFIDSIFVAVEGDITKQPIDTLLERLTIAPPRHFDILNAVKQPSGLALTVFEETNLPFTGVDAGDTLTVSGGILSQGKYLLGTTIAVRDSAAPVILSATFSPGDTHGDSLVVVLSETVDRITRTQPFRFGGEQGRYSMKLNRISQSSDTATFTIEELIGVDIPGEGDSVWIDPDEFVGDTLKNIQNNPDNRRAFLRMRARPVHLVVRAVNNPYTPGNAPLPPAVLSVPEIRQSEGLIIMVEPGGDIRRSAILSGTISIYDVVKNPVVVDKDMAYERTRDRLYFVWDGSNRNGRRVGTGTYLARIHITDNAGLSEVKLIRIGVKR